MAVVKLSNSLIHLLLVFFLRQVPQHVHATSCTANSDCTPQVDCKVKTWECISSTDTGIPQPGQSKHCCEYLDTCETEDQVSGWAWLRDITVDYLGKSHRSTWIDNYITEGNSTYIVSNFVGAWSSFTDNCDGSCTDDQRPSSIYVMEPTSTCSEDGVRKWPEWYQIALATMEMQLNITDLTIDEEEERDCLCDSAYTCNLDTNMCEYMTVFDAGMSANDTQPLSVVDSKCYHPLGIESTTGTIDASSFFASGYEANTSRLNTWMDHGSVEGGWAPTLNDLEKWLMVTFENETWVSGIITQGMARNIERRVDTMILEYQNISGDTFVIGKDEVQVFYLGSRLDTEVVNYFHPVRAISLTIHILTPCDPGYVGMRFELIGCPVCQSNEACGNGGLCFDGLCNYGQLLIDEENFEAGLEILAELNATAEEEAVYTEILGYGTSGVNETIDFQHVTINVANAALKALTNISVPGNHSAAVQQAVALQSTARAMEVFGDPEAVAFKNLDTPEAIEGATDTCTGMVNLMASLFTEDQSGGWDTFASIKLGIDDTTSDGGSTGGTDGGGDGGVGDGGGGDGDGGSAGDGSTDGGGGGGGTDGGGASGGVVSSGRTEEEEKSLAKAAIASSMLSSVSNIGSTIGQQLEVGEKLEVRTDTLVLEASNPAPDELEDEGFKFESGEKLGTSVDVNSDSFNFDNDNGTTKVTITSAVVDTTALRLAVTNVTTPLPKPQKGIKQATGQLASNMLSFECIVNGEALSIPINYDMRTDPPKKDKNGNPTQKPRCVYHDETVKDETVFSTRGIKVGGNEDNCVKCVAGHTTTFAVMMYLDYVDVEEDLGSYHAGIQDVITKVCTGMSVLALAAAIGVLVYLRSSLMSERIIIHMTLMVTTCLATLTFMLGADRTESEVMCKVITVLLHFLYTAMFSWMLVEGIHLYRQIIQVFDSEKSRLSAYFILGWGIPVLIVGITTCVEWDKYGKAGFCFLQFKDNTLWAFIGPIIPIIVINFIVLIRVAKVVIMATQLQDTGDGASDVVKRVKAGLRSSVLLLPILGMTWVIGFIQHLAVGLSYLFVILNSLQVRGAIRQRIKKAKDSSFVSTVSKHSDTSTQKSRLSSGGFRGNKVAPVRSIKDVD